MSAQQTHPSSQRRDSSWRRPARAAVATLALFITLGGGCGADPATTCTPGARRCAGSTVYQCAPTGASWAIARSCSALGLTCVGGVCSAAFQTDAAGDSGVTDAAAPPSDTGVADTGPADSGIADTGPADTGVTDTGPADTGTPDTGTPDAGTPDTGALDTGSTDTGADPYQPGPLAYARVPNILAKGDLRRVCWHPSGLWALILGQQGLVLRYDVPPNSAAGAVGTLSKIATLGVDVASLEAAADGSFFVVVGTLKSTSSATANTVGQLWRLNVDAGGKLQPAVATKIPYGVPVAVRQSSKGTWAIGARKYKNYSINYLYTYDPTAAAPASPVSSPKGFNAYGGMTGMMWVDAALPQFGGSEVLLTSHGYNGTDSKAWLLSTGDVVSSGWPGGFGNAGRGAWRPGGAYGMFAATSTNKVYVYTGAWAYTALPGVGTAAGPQTIAWKPDGTRALAIGRPVGSSLSATVVELRAGKKAAYDPLDWVNVSIQGFGQTPWFGDSSTFLNDVAWRPNSACDEGLIVTADPKSGAFGMAIRFYDSTDPACK